MPNQLTFLLLAVLALAVVFDYINGFHDTANAIATSVSTRALRPSHAILMSATANFVGALTGTAVATTISKGLADTPTGAPGQTIVAAALVGATIWNLITWRLGIPSSSSHALIGGLLGAVATSVGVQAIDGVINTVVVPLVLSRGLGILIGFGAMVVILNVFKKANPRKINDRFRRLQVLSAAAMAFSHGSNDAQKTMGIMTLALVSAGLLPTNATVPLWVIVLAGTAISFGTAAGGWRIMKTMGIITLALFAAGVIPEVVVPTWVIVISATALSAGTAVGGWRIMKTMGQRVVKLDPVHGFAAETTAASIIYGASLFGMPVSTTHVISSAIMGAGASDRFSAVRWGVAGNIVIAWILTIPASAAAAALAYVVLSPILK